MKEFLTAVGAVFIVSSIAAYLCLRFDPPEPAQRGSFLGDWNHSVMKWVK